MAIGNLKPIKLLQYGQAIDTDGDATEEILTTYKMWAQVEDGGGSRSQEAGRTAMSDTKTFKVNFRDYLITGDYKIEYFGQTYAVTNVQRIQEKRFNYLLTAFNTFESSTGAGGGGGGELSNFTILNYDQVNGVLQFSNGNLAGNYLQVLIKEPNNPSQNYYNRWNEFITTPGPTPLVNLPYVYFTPNDSILVRWYIVSSVNYQALTDINEEVITCERLCIRNFRLYEYGVLNSPLAFSLFDSGVYPYNVNGDQLAVCYSIQDYVDTMNADPVNAQYFQITGYILNNGSYLLRCAPVDPYYQWNPLDTLLYLEGEPA